MERKFFIERKKNRYPNPLPKLQKARKHFLKNVLRLRFPNCRNLSTHTSSITADYCLSICFHYVMPGLSYNELNTQLEEIICSLSIDGIKPSREREILEGVIRLRKLTC